MIELQHLTKRYGTYNAIDDVSFSVREGETLGFLGRNGAGKTTTMNILTGYTTATEGTVRIDGLDITQAPRKARARIGYLPEQPPLYGDMQVREYLQFVCALKGVETKAVSGEVDRLMRAVDILDMRNRLIRNLSKGYRQRVGIAQAMAGSPPYVILDEPTVGLDPVQIHDIRELIRTLRKKQTVILSSHILSEVEEVCERVIVIHQGHLLAETTMDALRSRQQRLRVRLGASPKAVEVLLAKVPGVKEVLPSAPVEKNAADFTVVVQAKADPRGDIARLAVQQKWNLLELRRVKTDLEQFFLETLAKKEGKLL